MPQSLNEIAVPNVSFLKKVKSLDKLSVRTVGTRSFFNWLMFGVQSCLSFVLPHPSVLQVFLSWGLLLGLIVILILTFLFVCFQELLSRWLERIWLYYRIGKFTGLRPPRGHGKGLSSLCVVKWFVFDFSSCYLRPSSKIPPHRRVNELLWFHDKQKSAVGHFPLSQISTILLP